MDLDPPDGGSSGTGEWVPGAATRGESMPIPGPGSSRRKGGGGSRPEAPAEIVQWSAARDAGMKVAPGPEGSVCP